MKYYNVFDSNYKFIAQVGIQEGKEPVMYDPRINGDGNVIWQLATN